jgi:hypothetical protein
MTQASEWRPIEEAPKDGTHVVVFAALRRDGTKRRSRRGCAASVAHYEQGWGWLSTPSDYQLHPTHFMPLPEPPKVSQPEIES